MRAGLTRFVHRLSAADRLRLADCHRKDRRNMATGVGK
jgi:hypothetical protein